MDRDNGYTAYHKDFRWHPNRPKLCHETHFEHMNTVLVAKYSDALFFVNLSYRQYLQNADFFGTYLFIIFNGFCKRHMHNFVVYNTNHHTTLFIEQRINGCNAHATCQNTVECSRRATSLQMSKNRNTNIIIWKILSANPCAPPPPSATTTILLFFDLRIPLRIKFSNSSTDVCRSGITAASAPAAMALFNAKKPASRPMTSTKNKRSCDVAVSRILSTHCIIVFNAVS